MSGMNEFLAAAYGTGQPSPAPQEDAEKVAHAEMFAKLAAESGIDLSKMSEEDIASAWNSFYAQTKTAAAGTPKTAADHGHKHKHKEAAAKVAAESEKHGHKHKHKEAAARSEFEQTKQANAEWQQKTAEADFLGRQMAHAYVDELKKIAAGTQIMGGKTLVGGFKAPMKDKLRQGAEHMAGKAKEKGKAFLEQIKKHKGKAIAGAAAGAAGAAGAGYAAGKNKKASALDELAAQAAIVKAAEAGYDAEEAIEKMAGLLEAGPKDSEKIASAEDYNVALEVRSLELLEEAGYPVNWPEA